MQIQIHMDAHPWTCVCRRRHGSLQSCDSMVLCVWLV